MSSVIIPSNVTSIGEYAFAWCNNLISIIFLGHDAPTTSNDWILGTNIGIRGHAYAGSNFPAPGGIFDGLTMSEVIYSSDDNNYSYNVSGGIATITGYKGPGRQITIPSTLGGYPTVAIADSAFKSCGNLTSIIIPRGITTIGNWTFDSCFALTSVTIPDSVISIGYGAFNWCPALTSINVSAANPIYASIDGVLYDKNITTLIRCPETKSDSFTIPDGVITIGNASFVNCQSLKSVELPDSVVTIGSAAFEFCYSLASITIPDGVTSIGSSSFMACSALNSVTIPDNVTTIGESAFFLCTSLTEITIPYGITIIDYNVFDHCTSLTSVTIPDSVTSIGDRAFEDCTSLTNITIPERVASIGKLAFAGCEKFDLDDIPRQCTIMSGGRG